MKVRKESSDNLSLKFNKVEEDVTPIDDHTEEEKKLYESIDIKSMEEFFDSLPVIELKCKNGCIVLSKEEYDDWD